MNRLVVLLLLLCWPLLLLASPVRAGPDCGIPLPGAEAGYDVRSEPQAGDTGCRLVAQLQAAHLNLHSVLILRGGTLVFEHYSAGRDEPWGSPAGQYVYGVNDLHDIRSVSKSVVSLLVGIAVDRGLIRNIDQSMFDFLPGYRDLATAETAKISVRMLLTMTSGFVSNEMLPYSDRNNTERIMAQAPDPYRAVLQRPVLSPPGTRWSYSGGDTMLLSKILQTATGQDLTRFAEENLFKPLEISSYRWLPLKASGEIAAYGSLKLRPRDMAKIGLLVLQGGIWQGRQVVSTEWLKTSTQPQHDAWFRYRYSMHWWSDGAAAGTSMKTPAIVALGIGGQRIIVLPDAKAVIVITAGLYDDPSHLKTIDALLSNILLPTIDSL
jgi:CubicO group peptidase (beta-lactamase class C family)